MNTRTQAARALAPVIQQRASLSSTFDPILASLPVEERGFFKELCFGVTRHYFSLRYLSQKLLSKPFKEKDSDVQALVLLGLYQLKHMRVPDHAAISETVNAAKKLKKPWAGKVINGVLRNYQRQQDKLDRQLTGHTEGQTEHPQWLFSQIKDAWPDHWREIIQAANNAAPLTLRINRQRTTTAEYLTKLTGAGISASAGLYSDSSVILAQSQDITALPGFADGEFSVQDEAAQLSANLLDLKSGQRVLDACCAPGGKTCHILEHQPDLQLTALELEASRMQRVEENLQRLKLQATLKVADAGDLESWWDGQVFDRILLDAPCSATGVIRRHPDIKLLRRAEDIPALSELQQTLLHSLWQTLAPGGLLLYATCSILPQENEETLARFVEQHPDALHLPIDSEWGIARSFGRQLLPGTQTPPKLATQAQQLNTHDGFYYARIMKRA
ncbi:Ribosomal RNA small subunit methyltransferase B [Thalassocella blandensis]|nr:Ribosomal RNA small subunit methyltransferase B [Thalassocella blandensis]